MRMNETPGVSVVALGKPYPGMQADNRARLNATLAGGQFQLNVVIPHVTRQEIMMFNKQATFTAIHEGRMLYLAVSFGDGLGLDSTYTIHRDSPEAMAVPLPRVQDLPDGEAPILNCILIDSATAVVKGIRMCVPAAFTRAWLAAVHEQKRAAYDQLAEFKWAVNLLSSCPTIASLTGHPLAVTSTMEEI